MVRVFVLGGTGSVGSAVVRELARSDASAAARRIWRDIRLGVAGTKTSCYAFMMTAKKLKDVLQRVETWPETAQVELAELALEIDAQLDAGRYIATPAELSGIDRGLKAAREGRLAKDEQVEELFNKHRPV